MQLHHQNLPTAGNKCCVLVAEGEQEKYYLNLRKRRRRRRREGGGRRIADTTNNESILVCPEGTNLNVAGEMNEDKCQERLNMSLSDTQRFTRNTKQAQDDLRMILNNKTSVIKRKMSPPRIKLNLCVVLVTILSCLFIDHKPQVAGQQMLAGIQSTSPLPMEPRDGPQRPQPQGQAFNQLVNLLSSFQQQQQQQNNNNQRRSPNAPLPLGSMGSRGIPPMGNSAPASSTPVNPFVAAIQFQPTRRLPPANSNQVNGQQFGPLANPPALTLNRINANSQQGRVNFAGPNNNNNNNLLPPPINTAPFGSFNANNANQQPQPGRPFNQPLLPAMQQPNSNGRGLGNVNLAPNQQANLANRQTNGQQFNVNRPPAMAPPPPPPQFQQPGQVRPISGFAPSGPPPSSTTNNAINVVQSPPNAIGQPLAESTTTTTTTDRQELPSATEASDTRLSNTSRAIATTTGGRPATTTTSSEPATTREPAQTTTSSTTTSTTSSSATEKSPDETPAPWNPVDEGVSKIPPAIGRGPSDTRRQQAQTTLAPSPDIVTVPPGYDPDKPPADNYDIAVSAQMGGSRQDAPSVLSSSPAPSSSIEPSASSILVAEGSSSDEQQATAAPTAITTITWSPPPSSTEAPDQSPVVRPTPTRAQIQPTRSSDPTRQQTLMQTATSTQMPSSPSLPSRIRDNSLLNDDPTTAAASTLSSSSTPSDDNPTGVVYGKAPGRDSKPTGPPPPEPPAGRPFIQTAQLDNQVRPFSAGASPGVLKSNHGSLGAPFKASKPLNAPASGGPQSGMNVGSGFTIFANGNQTMPTGDIQDYVAGQPPPILGQPVNSLGAEGGGPRDEPTISAQGGPDPASSSAFDLAGSNKDGHGQVETSSSSSSPAPRLRRPTFKPKPAVPPIRIDSCIVGDDSSCDQSHNERCVTEYGISSCHCKPGFARLSQLRGFCSPISLLQLNLKIDKLSDDRRLVFNHSLENPNSEEYQYLEFETIQGLASAIQQTQLAKQFMGARVNKFYERKGRIYANMSINLEANNVTKMEKSIQQLAAQELHKFVQQRQRQPLGDSTIMLDPNAKESISKLVDVNECASKELNDCSKHATCTNDFGGFQCQCLPGYEDKYQPSMNNNNPQDVANNENSGKSSAPSKPSQPGRVCMGCSASYCSNRGDCSIIDGKKQCKCRPNFMGARCDIDSEVVAVAVGGSLVGLVILVITFWCLFVFNRKWRREQQKMDAMSATSGLTFNYVNSAASSNSLMTPARPVASGPTGRSGTYGGQRFGLMGGRGDATSGGYHHGGPGRHHSHYPTDQQAIIGSTSSGSSASSQPIACNPYAPGYQYEDGGLLIAPASTGSSEQTSPSGNSYRGIIGPSHSSSAAMMAAGNAYTLSGYHHHHHHQAHLHAHNHSGHHHHMAGKPITQFHPAADYRTLNTSATTNGLHCPTTNGYDNRWRTLQQDTSGKGGLVGYYLVR